MTQLPLTALATLLVVALIFWTGLIAGKARVRYGIKAPAMTGHELFERAYRVQMNTLESSALLLPSLWLCATFSGDRLAAAMALLWVLARIWYALAYQRDPARRGPGFGLSLLAVGVMWVAAGVGILRLLGT